MELFNAIFLFALSCFAAWLSVGYKHWARLQRASLPTNDPRPWWVRTPHSFFLRLSYEAFFRASCLHITFAGASIAAVTLGYRSTSPYDAWKYPLVPFILCVVVGIWSQLQLNEDVVDKLVVSVARICRVVFFSLLTLAVYVYAVVLSILHWEAPH